MIKEFECMKVNNDITFEELLLAVTEKLSPYNDKRIIIQEDIKRRENIAEKLSDPEAVEKLKISSVDTIYNMFTGKE